MVPSSEICRDRQELIRSLYAEFGPTILAYVTRLLADRHHAEDVVQETMLRAWRNAHLFIPDHGSAGRWLMRVAHNVAIDKLRARNARPIEMNEINLPISTHDDYATMVIDSVFVATALSRLTPAHREVLREVYLADRTVADAASVLGVPVGTAKSRVHHGLRRLKGQLEKMGEYDTRNELSAWPDRRPTPIR